MARQKSGAIGILEEDVDWGKFAARTLHDAGYPFFLHTSLDDFIALLEVERPVLIVMGVSVIETRELAMFDTLRQAANATPMIVVASILTRSSMRLAFLRGAADVARKSFAPQDFLELIQVHLNSAKAADQAVVKAREGGHD